MLRRPSLMLTSSQTTHTFALRKGLSTVCAFVIAAAAGLPSTASAAPPGASAAQATGRSEGPPRGGYAPRRHVVPRGRYYSAPRRYAAPRYAPRYAPRGYGYRYAPAYRPRVVYRAPGPYWRPGPPVFVVQPQPVVVVEPAPAPYIVEAEPEYLVAPQDAAPPVGCEEPQGDAAPPSRNDGYEDEPYSGEESGDYDTDYLEAPEPRGRPTPSGQPEITRQWEAGQPPRTESHRRESPTAELSPGPSEADAGEVTLDQIEDEIVRLTNAERARAGLVPVAPEGRLMETARRHSEEMGQLGYFSHESPTAGRAGTVDRLRQEGVTGYQRASENIAMGTFDATSAARELVEMWMKSPGHRKNILDPDVFLIGAGAAQNEKGEIIATQVFTAVAEPALPDMPVGGRPSGTTDL